VKMIDRLRYMVSHNRIVTTMILAIGFLMLADPNAFSMGWGFPIILLGEIIRISSSGFIHKDSSLAQEGPYSMSRNPLYLGNFFLGFGFVIMASKWYLIGIFLILFYFIYDATIKEEEKKLLEQFGQSYEDYVNRVPRFFPNITGFGSWNGRFSWGLVKKHREFNTCYGILLGIGLIFLKMVLVS